ncbi:sugar ABC transporter substrate-binding protein [Caproiciproducens sp. MSJ-32]|uniref:sugar ABC transporter substrate-binding protein n=1 Tax=Caproiciproducens sp. MSJ-32 TaxID=2841527 RepID=UPI001C0F5025|nr:maltose ABC transporter substrate-binding protein [Caproiciproducens sp. MSJ-32]MBU5455966.1 maltose ABC transporter substrate-binding protein [Caproiciproducens sp. MSJ-32]
MGKRSKLLAVVLAGALAATSLVGCGGKSGTDSNGGGSGEKTTLTVWSHFTTAEVEEFDKIAKAWGEANNVEVTVVEDQGDFQAMIQAAQSDNGPDIILGVPHDNLGTYQKAGITAEVPSGLVSADKYTSEAIVDSVTLDGKIYAVPFAQETTALFVNKDLVKSNPATMEELVEMAKEVGFEYDINNFYFSYAFLAANGGYVYKNNNGTLDPTDIGLGNDGSVKGLQFLSDLVNKHKLMAADINSDIAKSDFAAGKTGFYISGPWDVQTAKDGGINFEIIPLPTLEGKAPQPLMGVQVAFVNANSKNQESAWKLMEEFIAKGQDVIYNTGHRIPVDKDYVVDDVYTKAFMEQAKTANPMPNIPEIQAMWTPANNNLQLLSSGQVDAKTAGQNMVDQVKEGISQLQ